MRSKGNDNVPVQNLGVALLFMISLRLVAIETTSHGKCPKDIP